MNPWMNGSWDAHLPTPADFVGADDIITNLPKEREPGIEIIERTPLSFIITSINRVPRVLHGAPWVRKFGHHAMGLPSFLIYCAHNG